jgi:N-acetylglucosaminyldiphosphoundecaprenol N-acetyl-beta-D-mannosaminyltransferase
MTSQLIHQQRSDPGAWSTIEADLLGRRISCMTVPEIVLAVDRAVREHRRITVANYNVHSFNLSVQLPWYYQFLQEAEIAHCDGLGILYALRFMGYQLSLSYRASYTLLIPQLLEHCDRHHFSVFLLGAKPHILERALERLQKDYPNINFQGHHGYFSIQDPSINQAVIEQINAVQPQVLLMGMGMPVQERWVQAYKSQLQVNAILMGGAVIDRLAGIVPDCPALLSNIGLEWLFRLVREPKRLSTRYLLGNPAFVLQVMLAKYQGVVSPSLDPQSAKI